MRLPAALAFLTILELNIDEARVSGAQAHQGPTRRPTPATTSQLASSQIFCPQSSSLSFITNPPSSTNLTSPSLPYLSPLPLSQHPQSPYNHLVSINLIQLTLQLDPDHQP
jgi:hypothetical protein